MASIESAASARALPGARVTWLRVLHSEWTKFRTLRSSYIILAIAVILLVGLAALIAFGAGNMFQETAGARGPIRIPVQSVDIILGGGLSLAQLVIGVFGVTVGTNEYSTGMIRATLVAVPKRWPVLIAKATLIFLVTFVVMVPTTFIAFFIGQAIVAGYGLEVSISEPGVIRALIGAGLYLGVVAIIGLAIGSMLRTAAGAIATLVGVLLLVPILLPLIQLDFIDTIEPYLPSNAGQWVFQVTESGGPLDAWSGYAVFVGYGVVLIALAGMLLRRRDA